MILRNVPKKLSILLCIFMLVTVFSACGAQEAETSQTQETSGSTQVTTTEAETIDPFGKYEPAIEINAVRSLDGTVKFEPGNPLRESLEKNAVAKAFEEQYGIKFKYLWTPPDDQYEAKWNVAIASKDIPDMGYVSLKNLKMLVDGGLAEDMTEVVDKYASPLYAKALTDDGGIAKMYNTFSGRLMGLPVTGFQPDDQQLLFVRADWLKKLNLPEPKTIDDVYNIADAFVKNQAGGTGTIGLAASKDIVQGSCSLGGFLNGYHAYYDIWMKDSSGNLVYSTIQPEMKNALLKLQDMYKAGLLDQEFAVKDFGKAAESIAAGKVGMTYGIFWAPLFKMNDNIAADKEADWKVYPIPSVDSNPVVPQASASPNPNTGYFFVRKGFKNPEAAVRIANIQLKLNSAEELVAAGIPNDNDGWMYHKYFLIPNFGPPFINADTQLKISEALRTGDDSKLDTNTKDTVENIKKALAGDRTQLPTMLVFGENSTYSIINKYRNEQNYITNAYKTLTTQTMDEKGQNMKLKLDEMILSVIMGAPVDEFDKAVESWKIMGGDEITREVNDWYQKNHKN